MNLDDAPLPVIPESAYPQLTDSNNEDNIINKYKNFLKKYNVNNNTIMTTYKENKLYNDDNLMCNTTNKLQNNILNATIDIYMNKYNKLVNQLYYNAMNSKKEVYKEKENKFDLFNGVNCMKENVLHTKLYFYIINDELEINKDIIKHYPFKSESYVYFDYSKKVENIYFLLYCDNKFNNNPNELMDRLPLLICDLLKSLNKVNLLINSTVSLNTYYDYLDDNSECLLTEELISNIYKAIYKITNINYIENKNATHFNIIDDEDEDDEETKEEINELPDEYNIYEDNRLLCIYMKLSKLRKNIDLVRKKLMTNYIKNKFIKNRLSINNVNKRKDIMCLFTGM
jgi:hypothetical protein